MFACLTRILFTIIVIFRRVKLHRGFVLYKNIEANASIRLYYVSGAAEHGEGTTAWRTPHFFKNKKMCAFFIGCVPFRILNSQ